MKALKGYLGFSWIIPEEDDLTNIFPDQGAAVALYACFAFRAILWYNVQK
jgi:hypothetical protein